MKTNAILLAFLFALSLALHPIDELDLDHLVEELEHELQEIQAELDKDLQINLENFDDYEEFEAELFIYENADSEEDFFAENSADFDQFLSEETHDTEDSYDLIFNSLGKSETEHSYDFDFADYDDYHVEFKEQEPRRTHHRNTHHTSKQSRVPFYLADLALYLSFGFFLTSVVLFAHELYVKVKSDGYEPIPEPEKKEITTRV